MMSKGFALGAVMLVALVPCVAHAGLVVQLGDSSQGQGTILFTSPTQFELNPPGPSDTLQGDIGYYHSPLGLNGSYSFESFSPTPGATSLVIDLGPGDAHTYGTVDWTVVGGSPTSPELIGMFTSAGVGVSDPSALGVADFVADFAAGKIDQINVLLGSASALGFSCGANCYEIYGGEILAPEPASLSILGVALGIFLMARRAVRRPTFPVSAALA